MSSVSTWPRGERPCPTFLPRRLPPTISSFTNDETRTSANNLYRDLFLHREAGRDSPEIARYKFRVSAHRAGFVARDQARAQDHSRHDAQDGRYGRSDLPGEGHGGGGRCGGGGGRHGGCQSGGPGGGGRGRDRHAAANNRHGNRRSSSSTTSAVKAISNNRMTAGLPAALARPTTNAAAAAAAAVRGLVPRLQAKPSPARRRGAPPRGRPHAGEEPCSDGAIG